VVEENAIACVDAVSLAVVDGDPVGIELGDGIRRAWIERCRLALGLLLHFGEELGGGGLVEAHLVFEPEDADRLQEPQRAEGVGVGGIFRGLEAHLDVALRAQVVNLGRLVLLDQPDQIGGVRQVTVVHEEAGLRLVRVDIEVVDPSGVERGGAPFNAVHDVAAL
jgi:hypothetical protein